MNPGLHIDLHRHLDGNIRTRTILELADKNGIRLPAKDEETLRPHVTVTTPQPGLLSFLEKFRWGVGVLASAEDCRRIAYENVEDAHRENLDLVELRFSPVFMSSPHSLNPAAVTEAVLDGIEAGRRAFGVDARAIGIMSRTYGADTCLQELNALLHYKDGLVAIDLAGDEAGFPPALFVEHFRRVRDAGLGITVHAGEAAGPQSVWDAISLLGATRIGHGVRAIEDPSLLEEIARRGIGLECCPTSNVQTSTVPDYADHPLERFLEMGLLATLNTDDPGISAITLNDEVETAMTRCGLSPDRILQCAANARVIAFPRR